MVVVALIPLLNIKISMIAAKIMILLEIFRPENLL